MEKRSTLKVIAEQAGVSSSMVSRALNNKYGVSPKIKNKVQKLAKEMGYYANTASDKKVMVALESVSLFDNTFYGKIVSEIEHMLTVNNLSMEIVVLQKWYTPEKTSELLFPKNAVGLIFVGKIEERFISEIDNKLLPIVLVDNYKYTGQRFDMVRANNYCLGYDAAQYLISVGHKKLAFVGNADVSVSFEERYRGFTDAVRANNALSVYVGGESSEEECSFSESVFKSIFTEPGHPDAIFCANDLNVGFVINYLSSIGLSVPDDVSIVGCDNAFPMLANGLTTMDVCTDEIGRSAVILLVDRIRNQVKSSRYIQVGSKIIKRNSVLEFSS